MLFCILTNDLWLIGADNQLQSLEFLQDALRKHSDVRSLTLDNNQLDAKRATQLARGLARNTSLQSLSLIACNLDVTRLCGMLSNKSSLTRLDLIG
jgi:hypothetical protein